MEKKLTWRRCKMAATLVHCNFSRITYNLCFLRWGASENGSIKEKRVMLQMFFPQGPIQFKWVMTWKIQFSFIFWHMRGLCSIKIFCMFYSLKRSPWLLGNHTKMAHLDAVGSVTSHWQIHLEMTASLYVPPQQIPTVTPTYLA